MFLGHLWLCFWAFFGLFCPMGTFSKKSGSVTHNYIWAPNTMLSFRKTIESILRKLKDRWKDGWKDGRKGRGTDGRTLFYRTLPAEAGYPKRIKWKSPSNSSYLNYYMFQISALTSNFDFLKQICHKKDTMFKNRKSEHYHWILPIRVRPSTKVQLKLTILVFWIKFAPNGFLSNRLYHWILHVQMSLGIKFHFEQTILSFWAKKRMFNIKTKNMNIPPLNFAYWN